MTAALTTRPSRQVAVDELQWLVRAARSQRKRTLREFAEQEIILPNGPYAGQRFRVIRQPYTGLFFDAIDSGRFRRVVATGPSQSGKTLVAFVILLMYHLFELGEPIVLGLPDLNMGRDKWEIDILPVIEASRYKDLLPVTGEGSRGGSIKRAIRFGNGATLRFMTGGGGDKARAAYTSRVVVITETDGMDSAGGGSREADKISQLEARTEAFGDSARIYMECTVSVAEGRTWREYRAGTQSRIVMPCPGCGEWVTPEREHFVGWQQASSIIEARQKGSFSCPACAVHWTDDQRRVANEQAKLLHAGQTIEKHGAIVGEAPPTDTLGFRWSAVNNLFASAAHLGAKEWRALHDPDEENSDRALKQFTWAVPADPIQVDLSDLSASHILTRMTDTNRGVIPPDITHLTAGIDLGKWLCHWTLLGFEDDATTWVIDYGRVEVPTDQMGEERALLFALREFRDQVHAILDDRQLDQCLVDAGWHPEAAYAFIQEAGAAYRPAKGFGIGQHYLRPYTQPKSTGAIVVRIGHGWHISRLKSPRIQLVEVDVDHWKSWLHARLRTPKADPGSLKLFRLPNVNDHLSFAKHLIAERQTEEFDPRRGRIVRWEPVHKNNHWLDASMLACAAGSMSGVRLIGTPKRQETRLLSEWFQRATEKT